MPFIDEFLVKLGFQADHAGYQRFNAILRDAERMVEQRSGSMVGSFLGAQTAIVGAFTSIGAAAIGMVDKVAMADQDFRLFAMHMYMSKDAARSLKVAMDALGQPLENLTWDPELRGRTRQLIEDQRRMAPGSDFDDQMRKVRDIRFEFTRMDVELKYLAMHTVLDFLHALGTGPDDLLNKLKGFNEWVINDMPALSHRIVTEFMPIWGDIKDIARETGHAFREFGLLFTNVIGLLSGDNSIEGTTFDFEKMVGAIHHVTHGFAEFAEAIANVEEMLAHLVSALSLVMSGKFSEAGVELQRAWQDVSLRTVGMVGGAVFGGVLGGPMGAVLGGGIGTVAASGGTAYGGGTKLAQADANVAGIAKLAGISPDLLAAVMQVESGGRQTDRFGKTLTSSAGALGMMQLMPGTAKQYGVDPNNQFGNMTGGAYYLRDLMKMYGGDEAKAVGAYNWGQGNMDKFLAGKATMPDETRNEIAKVMGLMGKSGTLQVGSVQIIVKTDNPSPDQIRSAALNGMKDAIDGRVQRNLTEFQSLGYSY